MSLEKTTVGSGAMAGVLGPDGAVADLEFGVTCWVAAVAAEFVGSERRAGVAVMLVAGSAAAGRGAAVVGRAVFGAAAPGCRGVGRGSSWALFGSRGVGEALLPSGEPA